jgi:hypothetical protein
MNTEQAASEGVQSFIVMPGGKDAPRGLSLVRVKVTNPKCIGLSVGKNIVPRGTHELYLYPDELEAAKRLLLETNTAAVAAAETAYEMNIAQEAAELLGYTGGLEDLIADYKRGDARTVDAFVKAKAMTAHSVEAAFHAVNKRAIKPLTLLEVIGEPVPEPQREKAVDEQNTLAAMVAKSTAEAMAPAMKAMADSQALLAEALKALAQGRK